MTSGPQRVGAIQVWLAQDFDALRAALAQAGVDPAQPPHHGADVFCTLPWFENLTQHGLAGQGAGAPARPLLALAHDPASGRSVCLPLLSGTHLEALANYYSSLYAPVAWASGSATEGASGDSQALWDSLCRQLRRDSRQWPLVRLGPLDSEGPFFRQMSAGLRHAGYWVDDYFCFGNWYLVVDNRPFAQYYPTLPSALRHSIERGQRRLGRHGQWHLTIQQQADTALEGAIADFVQVYNTSWKQPEPHPNFIPGLARMAARQGWLRLGVLRLDGKPIAAQLWLVKNAKASIYKLAFANGFERFSAGSVLTRALMEHVIDHDQVQEVDYLTGDDAYKRDWMSHRRERRGIVAFHPGTLRGLWAAARHFLGKRLSG